MIFFRAIYLILYLANLGFNMIKSSAQTAFHALTGSIDPQIMKVKTVLKKPESQVILANSITLTPGTLTIDLDPKNQELTVAVLNARKPEDVIPFEGYIKGMME